MVLDFNNYISPRLKKYRVNFPKPENAASLAAFLEVYEVVVKNHLRYKNEKIFKDTYENDSLIVPQVYFFDNNGVLIAIENNPDIFIYKGLDLNRLTLKESFPSNLTLEYLRKWLEGDLPKRSKSGNPIAIITWSVYAGDINKDFAFKWIELFDKAIQKGLKIEYYLLNCDMQEHWDAKFF